MGGVSWDVLGLGGVATQLVLLTVSRGMPLAVRMTPEKVGHLSCAALMCLWRAAAVPSSSNPPGQSRPVWNTDSTPAENAALAGPLMLSCCHQTGGDSSTTAAVKWVSAKDGVIAASCWQQQWHSESCIIHMCKNAHTCLCRTDGLLLQLLPAMLLQHPHEAFGMVFSFDGVVVSNLRAARQHANS